MPDLQGIVQKMIDAGESEENIAAVIQHFKTQPSKPPSAEDYLPQGPQGSAVGRFASNAADVLNPIAAVKGAYQAVRHPIDTATGIVGAQADQFRKAKSDYNQGHYSEMLGHGAAGLVPLVGPAAAQAGEQIASGDVAGGLGRGFALAAAPAVAEGAIRGVAAPLLQRGSLRLMQAALKPTDTLVKARAGAGYGSKEAIAQAVLDEGRVVSPGSAAKAQAALDETDAAAHAKLRAGAGAGVTVDPFQVTKAIDAQSTGTFGKQINAQPDTAAIQAVHENFANNPYVSDPVTGMGDLPADLAHEFAMNTGKNLKGKFGRLGGATVEAEKAGRQAITGQLRTKIPELSDLWDTEARQMTARDALDQAVARRSNTDPLGLSTIVGAVRSPTLALGAMFDRSGAGKSMLAQAIKPGALSASLPTALRDAILARLVPPRPTGGAQ